MTYANSLALGRQQTSFAYRNKNAVSFRRNDRKLGPVSNTIILVVLACLLGLLYLTQVTKAYPYSFTISKLQQQQQQLSTQHDNLEASAARLESVQRVQQSAVAKSMVAVTPSASVNN